MRKKQVTKKQAATGRPVKCRDCYVTMGLQMTLDGHMEYICPKCGRIWLMAQGEPAQKQGGKSETSSVPNDSDIIDWLFKL